MANEVTVSGSIKFEKDGTKVTVSHGPLQFDVSGKNFIQHRQSIGTSEEAMSKGETAFGGWLIMINHDATNYVEWYAGSAGTILGKMEAGEIAGPFRTQTTADIYLKANTAACDVEFILVDP